MKKFLVVTVVACCAVGAGSVLMGGSEEAEMVKEGIAHVNPIDQELSLYSERKLPTSAVESNPEFKNISFNTQKSKNPFRNEIASVIQSIKSLTKNEEDLVNKEYGTWIWTPIMQMSPAYMESMILDAKKQGVNVIYISTDSYLDIFTLKDPSEKEKKKWSFSNKLDYFIGLANHHGIAVDAEAGWKNWAEEGHTYKPFAIINFIKDFNNTHQNKFRGFQYDVEPYLLDHYHEDKEEVLKNFVTLIDDTTDFIGGSDLRFSVVVPDFYDEKDGLTPKFSHNGRKDYVFKHLLNILDRRQNSSIIIMSYRNVAEGPDGSIEVSQNEIVTAEEASHQTKIIIAQETGDVPPPYVTFHNTSRRYFDKQLSAITSAFSTSPSFGGIAVHYINTFLALR